MRLICAKCGNLFESLIIDKEIAWQDIQKQSVEHVKKKHMEEVRVLAQCVAIASVNLAMVSHALEFLVVPEQETFCKQKIDTAMETVMLAIGFDPDDTEDDEEEEEESEVEGDSTY